MKISAKYVTVDVGNCARVVVTLENCSTRHVSHLHTGARHVRGDGDSLVGSPSRGFGDRRRGGPAMGPHGTGLGAGTGAGKPRGAVASMDGE